MDIRSCQKFNKLPSGIRLFVPSEIFERPESQHVPQREES